MAHILVADQGLAVKRMAWGLGLCLAMSGAAAQQVWKCEVAGKVNFSDKPCPQTGQPVADRSLQPNMVEGLKPEAVRAAMAPASAASVPQAPTGNFCPGDSELRSMETRANSTTLGDEEKQFLQDEVRRVGQCRSGRGRYREADWAISREAQAVQTQLSDRVRLAARERAEAMHSAADPEEGLRIERRRFAQERIQRHQQRQQRLQGGQHPASLPTR